MTKFIRLYNTVKYLKFKQINFRLFYLLRSKFRKLRKFEYPIYQDINAFDLNLTSSINSENSYESDSFTFLNITNKFDSIDWNYSKNGKLWTYNLVYFDFLNQKNIDKETGLKLIEDFIGKNNTLKDAIEPFPISLRGINWIKFLTNNKIEDQKINSILFSHYNILLDNLEYHLLGNHLLENGFSLLFGAYYFEDQVLYKKAKNILMTELEEQILDDGAHFELSPMYHQLMLFRVLDCINLVQNNSWKNKDLLQYLEEKASLMLGWLEKISYENGEIPLLNDSTKKIAPSSNELFEYALRLNIKTTTKNLSESSYRKIKKENYECVVDVGEIGASYIPGHAHADTLNFELYIDKKPFIVDTGLSTYNIGKLRHDERSTKAHNTVEVNEQNSSNVWGSFRVANRASVFDLTEKENSLKATHDGYKKKYGVLHTREWIFEEDKIIIIDSLNKLSEAVARLHFHPDVTEEEIKEKLNIQNLKFKVQDYNFAPEFNKLQKALVLEIPFKKELKIEIKI